jgi:hypothetical protein
VSSPRKRLNHRTGAGMSAQRRDDRGRRPARSLQRPWLPRRAAAAWALTPARSRAPALVRLHAREHVAETSRHCRRSQARGAACLPAARGTQGGTRPLGAKAEAAPRPASARRYVRIVSWRVGGRRGTRGGRRVSSEKSGRVLLGKSQNLCGRPCATMSRREGRPG